VPNLSVDGFDLEFPEGWTVGKFDDWKFYRERFFKVRDHLKAMDVIAVCPDRVVYLIEFKDYRGRKREKAETVEEEFIGKSLSTLAALLPAKCNAREAQEQTLAGKALSATKLRLVLHLEQSKPGNKLFPPVTEAAALTQKLRNKLKSIDPHIRVCNSETMANLPWTLR